MAEQAGLERDPELREELMSDAHSWLTLAEIELWLEDHTAVKTSAPDHPHGRRLSSLATHSAGLRLTIASAQTRTAKGCRTDTLAGRIFIPTIGHACVSGRVRQA
jgi:hypothetical protein